MKWMRVLVVASCFGLLACSASNSLVTEKKLSYHYGYQEGSTLAKYYEQLRPETVRDNLTGFHSLNNGDDALLARIALITSAQHSLDLQYYCLEMMKQAKSSHGGSMKQRNAASK